MDAFWIILTGSLVAITTGMLGCYLVLRRMAMVGDAISHAVLPGIVLAFLLSGSREVMPVLLGAGALGLVTTFLIELFHRKGGLQPDASIGVTFTWLFALGIILTSLFTGRVDVDADCILYGEIAFVPLDTWTDASGTNLGPRAVWVMGGVLVAVALFIALGYKELLLTTFDPAYAAAIGISVSLWHYLLMAAVSITTVAAFESVGAILVVALLIGPPATAYLLTDSLPRMLLYTALLGVAVAVAGYYLASVLDASIAGAMSAVTGVFFTLALLFSPSQGIVVQRLQATAEAADTA